MKDRKVGSVILFLGLCLWLTGGTAEAESAKSKLIVFNPSQHVIHYLITLKEQGFLVTEEISVTGVYHAAQLTSFENPQTYVKEHKLDWIEFCKLTCEIKPENLFQKNPLSADFQKLFEDSDGVIFFGGDDIPPIVYGEKTHLLSDIQTPYRHFIELSAIFHLIGGSQDPDFTALLESDTDYPILGICLGCQSLNAGSGGTLIQDIWLAKYGYQYFDDVLQLDKANWHKNPYDSLHPEKRLTSYILHPIKLAASGKFCIELGIDPEDTPLVCSSHHQAIGKPGLGLKVIATSLDGKVVEAIEHKKYPNVLGVQFHPEKPFLWDNTTNIRITPGQKEGVSYKAFLKENPPSAEFHQKLWKWFFGKVKEHKES